MTDYPDYPTPLGEIDFAVPFEMLNYGDSKYIRVKAGEVQTIMKFRTANPLPFNDDGHHVPIVELATGNLFWMSKIKPCRVVSVEPSTD